MKRKFVSLISLLSALILSLCAIVACQPTDKSNLKASVVSTTDTVIVIQVDEVGSGTDKLIDAMAVLKESGALDYTTSLDGMVQSINGKENKADWSACWMLYTSDSEMANTEWMYEYEGVAYGSANLGAEALPVLSGALYVWVYTAF